MWLLEILLSKLLLLLLLNRLHLVEIRHEIVSRRCIRLHVQSTKHIVIRWLLKITEWHLLLLLLLDRRCVKVQVVKQVRLLLLSRRCLLLSSWPTEEEGTVATREGRRLLLGGNLLHLRLRGGIHKIEEVVIVRCCRLKVSWSLRLAGSCVSQEIQKVRAHHRRCLLLLLLLSDNWLRRSTLNGSLGLLRLAQTRRFHLLLLFGIIV